MPTPAGAVNGAVDVLGGLGSMASTHPGHDSQASTAHLNSNQFSGGSGGGRGSSGGANLTDLLNGGGGEAGGGEAAAAGGEEAMALLAL